MHILVGPCWCVCVCVALFGSRLLPNSATHNGSLSNKNTGIVKGRAIPLQAWTGPKGSSRLRLPDFKTIGT